MALEWKKVYVFISSTFNDMHAERDYLVKRVFPDLREWCEQRKLRLIDIDLRWGVTEADAASKKALKVCLQRINDCRPFFLCFLGQRHGWAPGKDAISQDTFDEFPELEHELQNHPSASITELEIRHAVFHPMKWRDPKTKEEKIYDPAEHAFFYLRAPDYLGALSGSPRQLLTIYTDEVGPEDETLEEEASRLRSLQALAELRKKIEIPGRTRQSPIHYAGDWREVLQTPELAMPLDCPHSDERNVAAWRQTWNRYARMGLSDADRSISELKRPEAAVYNSALISGRLADFRCIHPVRGHRLAAGTKLADMIKHDLQKAILERCPDREDVEASNDLQRELDQHEEFIANCVEGFVERAGDFDEINDYVNSDSQQLFVLNAPGGMGKSTLLGKWVDEYRKHKKIHARFVGQSDASSTVYSLMRYLLRELKEVHQKLDAEIPEDPNELRRAWPDLLKAVRNQGKTVIVIDALNQLESGLSDLTWLPLPLPENIKMIVSLKVDDQQSRELCGYLKSDIRVRLSEVRPFTDRKDREALVDRYLDQYWKELDPQLLEALIGSPGAVNPLYLKVVLSELRVFGAFANLSEKIRKDFGDTPVSAFDSVLQRLENDPAYSAVNPKEAVPLLFGLLAHARHGLSVDELTAIFVKALNLFDNEESGQAAADTIHLFLRQVRPFLARREDRFDYFYESFKIAAKQRYVTKDETEDVPKRMVKDWHRLIADYFEDLPTWKEQSSIGKVGDPTRRKVAELPFHLTGAQEWKRLESVLTDLKFIEGKCTGGMTYDLIGDYNGTLNVMPLKHRKNVAEFAAFMRSQHHILSRYPHLTFQQAANEPDHSAPAQQFNRTLRAGQEIRPWFRWVNKPQVPNPCILTVHGETGPVTCCLFSLDGKEITVIAGNEVQVWSIESGIIRSKVPTHDDRIMDCFFTPDGESIMLAGNRSLSVWNAASLMERMRITEENGGPARWIFSPNYRQCACILHQAAQVKLYDLTVPRTLAEWPLGIDQRTPAVFHGEGSRIVIQGKEGILLFDTSSLALVAKLQGDVFSMGENTVATGSLSGEVILYDVRSGAQRRKILLGKPVHRCKLLPGENRILLEVYTGTHLLGSVHALQLWDLNSQTLLSTIAESVIQIASIGLEKQFGSTTPVSIMGFALWPDKSHVAAWPSYSTFVSVWETKSGQRVTDLKEHSSWIQSCSIFSSNLDPVITCYDGTIVVWDGTDYTRRRILRGHTGAIHRLYESPDGNHLATVGEDHSLKIWDYKTKGEPSELSAHSSRVSACMIASNNRLFSGAHDGILKCWDAESGQFVRDVAFHKTPILAAAVSPDGGQVACIGGRPQAEVHVWYAATGQHLLSFGEVGEEERGARCRFTPDGIHFIAIGGYRHGIGVLTGKISIWQMNPLTELFSKEFPASVVGFDLTRDSRWALFHLADATFLQWDFKKKTMKEKRGVKAFAVFPIGNVLLFTLSSGDLEIFNLQSDAVVAFRLPNNRSPAWRGFSRDGLKLAEWPCGIWHLDINSLGFELAWECPQEYFISFSHNGNHVISCVGSESIRMRNANNGLLLREYHPRGYFNQIDQMKGANRLVIGTKLGEVHLLALEGTEIAVSDKKAEFRKQRLSGRAKSRKNKGAGPKVGRNEACPCGSGKKYSRCHGKL